MDSTQFITILLTLIAGFGLLFYKAYFSESGKNKATIEFAPLITQIQETIRSELGYKQAIKIEVYQDRKKAATNLNNSFRELNKFLMEIKIVPHNIDSERLLEIQNKNLELSELVDNLWVKMEILLTKIELKNDYFQWRASTKHLYNIIEIFIENRIDYNRKIEGNIDGADEFSEILVSNAQVELEKQQTYFEKGKKKEIDKLEDSIKVFKEHLTAIITSEIEA